MHKLIRVAAVSQSLKILLKGQLRFLNKYFHVIGIASPDMILEKVTEEEGIDTIPVEIKRNISPINDLKSLYHLYRVFKKEKPKIIHSITPKAGLLSMTAGYLAGVPIRIHTFTGLIFPSKKGLFRQLLLNTDRLTCFFATRIYPEGTGVKRELIDAKITKKPLNVLANGNVNGIDVEYFTPKCMSEQEKRCFKEKLGILADDFVFIFVGRLVGDKGINELVASFRQIHKFVNSEVQLKLLLVGSLEEESDPLKKETLDEIRKNRNILAVGYQEDVRPYFAIANVLTFPSYREGFPNVVLQAGAMGLPSIATNISGCNEIIIEGKNGTLISSRNVEALQYAMIKMIDDEKWFHMLQKNARRMIKDRYEQTVVHQALLREYLALLEVAK